jgi:hypothetical protein
MVDESSPAKIVKKPCSLRMQIIAALILFISGIIVGFAVTAKFMQKKRYRYPRPPRMSAAEIAKDIGEKYELTGEQVKRVEDIFDKRIKARETSMSYMRKKMQEESKKFIADMNEVMGSEKAEMWKKDFEEKMKKFSRRMGPRHRKHEPKKEPADSNSTTKP